jgi:type IV secretory pathway TrbL component
MLVIIILLIIKTFFFLRIIESYTPIVIMLVNVIWDLKVFLFFYFILLMMYSLLFGVIGVGLDSVQPNDTVVAGSARAMPGDVAASAPPAAPAAAAAPVALVNNATAAIVTGAGRLLRGHTKKPSDARGGGGWIWGLRIEGGVEEVNDPNTNIPQTYQYIGMFLGGFV